MHKHFNVLLAEASAHKNKTQGDMVKDLETTIAHAARSQLGAFRDEEIKVTVDPKTGAFSIVRNGAPVDLDTLGRIHVTSDDLSSRTPSR